MDGDLRVGNSFIGKHRVRVQVVVRLGFFVFLENGGQRELHWREIETAGLTSGNSSRMDGV